MNTTRITKAGFALSVPASWTEVTREDGGFEVVSPDRAYQLIVSVLSFESPLDAAGRSAALERVVDQRLSAFRELAGRFAVLTPVERFADEGSAVTALIGADVAARVFAYVRVVATSLRIVTASLYRYRRSDDAKGFAHLAEEICKTVAVTPS